MRRKYYNPYEYIEYASFINKYAVYSGDLRQFPRKLIGVFDTLEQAQAARNAAMIAMQIGTQIQARYETATYPKYYETRSIDA